MKPGKNDKQKYNIYQNIIFSITNIWRSDKFYFMSYIPQIPLSVFLPLAGVYFPKLLIELIEQKAEDTKMLFTIVGYCVALMIAEIIDLFCEARISSTRYVFMIGYQNMTSEMYMTMDYEHTENPIIKDVRHRIYAGMEAAENIVKELKSLLIVLLGIFTYGGIIGSINPLILLLLIVTGIINYLTLTYVRNYTNKNKDKWTHLDRKNGYLSNISKQYNYAKDVKLYGMRVWLSELAVHYQKLRMKWHIKIYNKNLFAGIVDGFLRFIRDGVSYAVLITMLLNSKIDVGGFVFYFGAIAGFSEWLSSVADRFNTIIAQNIEINRLRAYMDLENRFNHGKGIPLPQENEIPYEITFKDLSYLYPGSEKPAVDGVNLTINKGEKIAVVGLNGAGKTTLVKLMCGLFYPGSGSVLLNGRDVRDYNIEEYYTQFSAVFQDIGLFPASIAQFVAGSNDNIDEEKIWQSLKQAGLDSTVAELSGGINTHLVKGLYDDGIDLSGGEKQKLILARALYKDAPVIVLDEPTSALDPIAENELYMKYADLTEGKTSVFISHRLSSTRFCDRIIFLQDGKIAEMGSHNELMGKDGLYANMFNIQSHYYKENRTEEAHASVI